MRDDVEVLVLVEGIERDPQPEALGERNFLLDRLAGMDFIADVLGLEVFSHVLGHQVAAVRRRIDEQVLRGGRDRAVERHLQRDVPVLGAEEAQVVAEQEETLGARGDAIDDSRQVNEVVFLDLDQAQALLAVLVEQALHDRRLAGAARAGQKHVVGGLAVDKLPRVLLDALDLPVDAAQVGEPDAVHVPHRLQPAGCAAAAARAPAIRDARRPIGRRGRRGQQLLEALENFL